MQHRVFHLLITALLFSGTACVNAEATDGSAVTVELRSLVPDGTTLPDHLDLVVDHVELLRCDATTPHHLLSHLPATPYRLTAGERWQVVVDRVPTEPLILGTLEPVPADYCGVRIGIYSALPDSPAVHSGLPEGLSLRAHWSGTSEVLVETSLGFDIEVHGDLWLTEGALRDHPVHITLSLTLPHGPLAEPRDLAQFFVDHSTISLLQE